MIGYILSVVLLVVAVILGVSLSKVNKENAKLQNELASEQGRANANEARRRELEEAQQQRENSHGEYVKVAVQGILNQDVGAVLVVSDKDEIIFFNNEFEQLFPNIRILRNIADQKEIQQLFKEEEYVSEELSKIYEIRTEKLEEAEKFSGRFIWLVDITGHYKTNKKLQELKEMADAANKAKTNFLANMSHEIRTPINTVLGMDEIILRETSESATRGYAENIREAGTTLLSIVNDLLDFSKIECGKMEILPVEYEVANLLTETINMIEIKAANKHLEFIPVVAEDIPYLLFGDEIRIKQIIINLLTNAVKYTKEGSVVLKVSWKEAGDSSIQLIVSVTDTGIGIKEEDMDRLFVSFERIEEERNRNIEGTGLGISITKQLLELMGSSLSVRSEYGVGSTFSFVLKQGIRDRKPIGKFREKYAYKKEKYKQFRTTFVAPNARILVVDDNAMNLSVVEGLLKNTQIQVDKAGGGAQALELCKENQYDIIFMDHMMPYMDGIETTKKLKEENGELNKETPVIVLTANAVSGAREMYLQKGFVDYMSKPIQGKRLEEKILEYLPQDKYVLVEYDEIEKNFYQNLWKEVADDIRSEYDFKYLDIPSAVESAEGDKECFRFLLESFRDNEEKNRSDIEKSFEAEDYKNYTIFVHALKSTSKMIGANELSEDAKALETAGKEENISYIKANHEEAMTMYTNVVQEIRNYFEATKDSE
ncbi:MAG: response regulator [Lachnospiraceae bacterium]|nr:response regulator [Lachnospiraceae bacterium]